MSLKQLVHRDSQMGGDLGTMVHGSIPSTNIEYVESFEDIYLPTSGQYTSGSVLTWQINGVDSYTALDKSYVNVYGYWQAQGNVTNYTNAGATGSPGSALTLANIPFSVVPGFPDTGLFGQQQLFINNQQVSPNRSGDPWIQFFAKIGLNSNVSDESSKPNSLEYLVNTNLATFADVGERLDTLDSPGTAQLTIDGPVGVPIPAAYGENTPPLVNTWYMASAAAPNDTYVNQPLGGLKATHTAVWAGSDGYNLGAQERYNRIISDIQEANGEDITNGLGQTHKGLIQYKYTPQLGAWNLVKLLPDRCDLRLQLTINDAGFYCIGRPFVTSTQGSAAGTGSPADFGFTSPGGTDYCGIDYLSQNGSPIIQFVITRAELVLHRVVLTELTKQQNNLAMLEKPYQ